MQVHVRLFAAFREIAGTDSLQLELGPDATVGELWGRLAARHGGLGPHQPAAAVNATMASLSALLRDGDEVAFLPPVSGG